MRTKQELKWGQAIVKITSCQQPILLYDCFFTWRLTPGVKVNLTQQEFGTTGPSKKQQQQKKTNPTLPPKKPPATSPLPDSLNATCIVPHYPRLHNTYLPNTPNPLIYTLPHCFTVLCQVSIWNQQQERTVWLTVLFFSLPLSVIDLFSPPPPPSPPPLRVCAPSSAPTTSETSDRWRGENWTCFL